ncbi:hypothetical protein [Nitrosopumilus sp.]|uniref:hypothetical protein n=1 Tax=Nitrosopumilus sp. TaxID=2024843 RepID=UPI002930E964|nr:hypothetical protein [Nitrosopumilus sp.]
MTLDEDKHKKDAKLYDIVKKTNGALSLDGKYRYMLSETANRLYDWSSVAEKLLSQLHSTNS